MQLPHSCSPLGRDWLLMTCRKQPPRTSLHYPRPSCSGSLRPCCPPPPWLCWLCFLLDLAGCCCHHSIRLSRAYRFGCCHTHSSCCGPVAAHAAAAPVVAPLPGPVGPVTAEERMLGVGTLALPRTEACWGYIGFPRLSSSRGGGSDTTGTVWRLLMGT